MTLVTKTENGIAEAWAKFAEELVARECPRADVDVKTFGVLMLKVIKKYGAAESVLWASQLPIGTEDRTWVRTWLCAKRVPGYEDMLHGLDAAHARRCLETFLTCL